MPLVRKYEEEAIANGEADFWPSYDNYPPRADSNMSMHSYSFILSADGFTCSLGLPIGRRLTLHPDYLRPDDRAMPLLLLLKPASDVNNQLSH
jgi:hypothetical protein